MNKDDGKGRLQFSEVYGAQREEMEAAIGTLGVRQATLAFMQTYPGALYIDGLRKLKARSMVTAVEAGRAERGNHSVTYERGLFRFYYRGTPIYEWNAFTDESGDVDAGAFEETASTRNQRKEIRQAIEDFREGLAKV